MGHAAVDEVDLAHPSPDRFHATVQLRQHAAADNTLLLFICWELTTVSSFFLVGFQSEEEEAREAAEVGELEGLHKRLLAHSREVRGHLAVQLDDERDYEAAADTVRRLMFIDKLQQEIDEALLALEN